MLTIAEALEAVMKEARALTPTSSPIAQALGCVLAEDVRADADSPPFDKALVDGYALRTVDLDAASASLKIGELITAGRTPTRPLAHGEAAVIMTGAPLPGGCDAVVMHERTSKRDDIVIIDQTSTRPGQNILRRGAEMRSGEVVLSEGSVLHPAKLGVLASVGRTDVLVIPRPRVSIVSTGDELVEPGEALGPGQIRNSNAVMLRALANESGAGLPRFRSRVTSPPSSPGPWVRRSEQTSCSSPAAYPQASVTSSRTRSPPWECARFSTRSS